jgi:hypothetical protein
MRAKSATATKCQRRSGLPNMIARPPRTNRSSVSMNQLGQKIVYGIPLARMAASASSLRATNGNQWFASHTVLPDT